MERDREMENAMSTPPNGPQHLSLNRLCCQFTKHEACARSYLVRLWWAAKTWRYWDGEATVHYLPDCTQTASFTKATGQLLISAAISCQDAHACILCWCKTRASHVDLFLSSTACCNLRDRGIFRDVAAPVDYYAHTQLPPADISSLFSIRATPWCLPRSCRCRHYHYHPLVNYQHATEVISQNGCEMMWSAAAVACCALKVEDATAFVPRVPSNAEKTQGKVIPVVANTSVAHFWDAPVLTLFYFILNSPAKKIPPRHNIVNPGSKILIALHRLQTDLLQWIFPQEARQCHRWRTTINPNMYIQDMF